MPTNQIKVKISTRFPYWDYKRQTPSSCGTWGNLDFYIDDDINECDYWIIFGGITERKTAYCYSKNIILVTDEPSSIKKYAPEFTKQFNTIVTIQKDIKARKIINEQLLPWYIGAHYDEEKKVFNSFSKSYDELKIQNPQNKTKLISVISSKKNKTIGHQERLKFVKILKKHFGKEINVFGFGLNNISDKWNAIAPYKYHIVLENSTEKNYWSEKLADSYLGESYPIYYGCPNIHDYFETNSLSIIDISNPENSIKTIEKIINNDYYNKYNKNILNAKIKILDQYQIFPQLHLIINNLEKERTNESKKWIEIIPEILKKDTSLKRFLGRIGIFVKNKSPNIYLKIKKYGKFK